MTVLYDIDLEHNVVFIGAYGAISIEDIEAAIKEIEVHTDFSKKMACLIDVREIKRAFFVREMDRLLYLLASEAANFVHRYAFIFASDIVLGVGRNFPEKARKIGVDLEVFNDNASAENWLKEVA